MVRYIVKELLRGSFPIINSIIFFEISTFFLELIFKSKKTREKDYKKTEGKCFRNIVNKKNKEITVLFLPYGTKKEFIANLGFFSNVNIIYFELPIGFLNKSPHTLKKIFLGIIEDINIQYKWIRSQKFEKIKVISCSASNGSGFYFSNNYDVDEFYSIVTGATIAEEIFQNFLLRSYKKDMISEGFKTGLEYDEVLIDKGKKLLPYYNCSKLPKKVTFYLSKFDKAIDLQFGNKMFDKTKSYNKNAEANYLYLNHHNTVLVFFYIYTIKQEREINIALNKLDEEEKDHLISKKYISNSKLRRELKREDLLLLSMYKIKFLNKGRSLFNEEKFIIKYLNIIIYDK